MKKHFAILSVAFMLCISMENVQASALKTATTSNSKTQLTRKQVTALYDRLAEIRQLDKQKLTTSQKQDLRKEVITIKQQLLDVGIYISAGALIVIVILLIILL